MLPIPDPVPLRNGRSAKVAVRDTMMLTAMAATATDACDDGGADDEDDYEGILFQCVYMMCCVLLQ